MAGQSRTERAFTVVTAALAVTTFLGWIGSVHPWFEMLSNVPNLMLAIAVIVLTAAAAAGLRRHAIVAGIATAWFVVSLVPYWFPTADPVPADGVGVRAMQFNVFFENDRIDDIATVIEDAAPDVVVLHEITTEQWDRLQFRMTEFPYALVEPWDGPDPQLGGGMVVLSRTPLTELEVDPAADIEGRPVLAAVTEIEGRQLVVLGLHPHASRFSGAKVDLRERQLDAVVDLLADDDRPAVILTDLNMAPTSTSYVRFLRDLGWRDTHEITGWDATWPAWLGPFGVPIDHVFVSDDIALHDVRAVDGAGSDHRALVADFSIE